MINHYGLIINQTLRSGGSIWGCRFLRALNYLLAIDLFLRYLAVGRSRVNRSCTHSLEACRRLMRFHKVVLHHTLRKSRATLCVTATFRTVEIIRVLVPQRLVQSHQARVVDY
jgi:hypothetical protein